MPTGSVRRRLRAAFGPCAGRALSLASLALLVGACSSPSAEEEQGTPLRVTYQSYTTGQRLELVSEAHTSRLAQYSEVRADASRKVQSNDVMAGLVEILDDHGFERYAQEGAMPADGGGRFTWGLEVEGPGGPRHVLAHNGLSEAEARDLQRYMLAFIDTYNATYGLQAVETAPGEEVFKTPGRR
jgi:hypothetical protein